MKHYHSFHDILLILRERNTMKVLVAYDSGYGNTEQISRAISNGISNDAKKFFVPVMYVLPI